MFGSQPQEQDVAGWPDICSARRPQRRRLGSHILNTAVNRLLFRRTVGISTISAALLGLSPRVAHTEQVAIPDVVHTTTTVDGWRVTLAMTDARVNAVPNLAAAPLSKGGLAQR